MKAFPRIQGVPRYWMRPSFFFEFSRRRRPSLRDRSYCQYLLESSRGTSAKTECFSSEVPGTHRCPRAEAFAAWLQLSFTDRHHDRALGRSSLDSHLSGRFVFQPPTIRTHSIRNEKAKRSTGRRECPAGNTVMRTPSGYLDAEAQVPGSHDWRAGCANRGLLTGSAE